MRKKLWRMSLLLVISYGLCCMLDYRFFDYDCTFIWFKQLISCGLMASFVLFSVALGYAGYAMLLAFVLLAGVVNYAYYVFGYQVTYEAVAALFQTDATELSIFVTPGFCLAVFVAVLLTVLLIIALRRLFVFSSWKIRGVAILGSLSVFCLLYATPYWYYRSYLSDLKEKMSDTQEYSWLNVPYPCSNSQKKDPEMYGFLHLEYALADIRVPWSDFEATAGHAYEYLKNLRHKCPKAEDLPSTDRGDDDLAIVLVIGESVRADHCSFNGYSKPTTEPLDSLVSPAIVPIPNFWSFGHSTYGSVKGIFSALVKPADMPKYSSFVGVLRKHGYKTHFVLENSSASVLYSDVYHLAGYAFDDNEKLQMPIEEVADDVIRKSLASKRSLVVVENGTGHYPYAIEERHRRFVAGVEGKSDEEREAGEVIANYDNAVYSVNLFLSRIIESVKGRNAVVIYCSDHGQLLGDDGAWFHGINKKQTRHVAAFIWFSPKYRELHPEYVKMVEESAGEAHHHGQLYPTILKLAGIESDVPLALPDLTRGLTKEQLLRARVPQPHGPGTAK